jgi:RTX toxins and related Ca2+-binding proteins
MTGGVAVIRPGETQTAVAAGHALFPGDRLVIGSGGQGTLRFADGSVMGLSENAVLVLDDAQGAPAVTVARGTFVLAAHDTAWTGFPVFTLSTPAGSVNVLNGGRVAGEVGADAGLSLTLLPGPNGASATAVFANRTGVELLTQAGLSLEAADSAAAAVITTSVPEEGLLARIGPLLDAMEIPAEEETADTKNDPEAWHSPAPPHPDRESGPAFLLDVPLLPWLAGSGTAFWEAVDGSRAGGQAFPVLPFIPQTRKPEPVMPPNADPYSGDNVYVVDSPGAVITEQPGGGIDTVFASIDFTLPDNVERLILTGGGDLTGTGNAGDNELIGNGGNNTLYGLGGADTLDGGAGNDVLDGGAGADTMIGGTGDDVFYVDNAGDVVIEAAGEGIDIVYAGIDYTLPSAVENLVLTGSGNRVGTGNSGDNHLTGNGGNNTLYGLGGNDTLDGGAGNDTLDGGAGADTMIGGTGNDVFIVDDSGDVVIELAGEGNDTVYTSLTVYTLPSNVERLIFNGSGDFTAYGNSGNNLIVGGSGTDTLYGMDGDDTLSGGANGGIEFLYGGNGNDSLIGGNGVNVLVGGYGSDYFFLGGTSNTMVYSKADVENGDGGDRISGFMSGVDGFSLEIPGLAPGVLGSLVNDLGSNAFTGEATGSATPQVIVTHWNGASYDSNTYLWVDYNGSGAGESYQVANLGSSTTVQASDITVT